MQEPIMSMNKTKKPTETFKEPEILAPAGDFECLQAAVRFKADAVYLGMPEFGMRAAAKGFGHEHLPGAVEFAHRHNVKVYLTVNIIPRNSDIETLPALVKTAAASGVDAFIVADIGTAGIIKNLDPNISLHISTQAGVTNYAAANEFYKLGASRIILARELTLDEIRQIRRSIPADLELEVFVHGAVCVSYAGRCLLSQYMTMRDANMGKCAQPCRWNYNLVEEKRPGEYFPVFEDEYGTSILSAADLCMLEHLDKLRDAGINGFKIEGRAKSMYYVSVITNAYAMAKKYLPKRGGEFVLPEWISSEVYKVSNRNYGTGFFFDPGGSSVKAAENGYVRGYGFAAVVEGYRNNCLEVSQRGKFCRGDTLEVLVPGIEPYRIQAIEMYDRDFVSIESAPHAKMKVFIKYDKELPKGSILRIRK
ncbi:MAG: U32 family peptidase [Oscillospiraceae bacterium]|nr:U32 family peptidase [Oscillospiraceae bacterium]